MKYIITGQTRSDAKRKLKVLVDDEDFDYLNQFNWQADISNSVSTHGKGNIGRCLIHRLIMDVLDNKNIEIDHIDGNRLNNQKSNLRLANSSQNKCNRGARKDNKSGYKGISRHTVNNCWVARIKIPNGKYKYLGSFKKIEDAINTYNKFSIIYHKEFSFINKII